MPQNIFKIYDGRTNFWQWDRGQRLIVLDESVTQVQFSNRKITHSIKKDVYEDVHGQNVCDVPDNLLSLPANLVAYAMVGDTTLKVVKFAVVHRPMPSDYVTDPGEAISNIEHRLEVLETTIREIEEGCKEWKQFNSIAEAEQWAQENQEAGIIVAINIDGKWTAYMVENDYHVTPICDCNGDPIGVEIHDGGDADGYDDEIDLVILDGGGAAGI